MNQSEKDYRKSSFSGTGNCVEVAHTATGIFVRDSKNTSGPELQFTFAEWDAFAKGMHAGEFDS
jgi:hypothetical protein